MKKIFAIAAAGIICLSSCNKWLDSTIDTSNITDQIVWQNEESANLYINGFYTYLHKYGQFGTYQFQGSLTESLTDTYKYGSQALGNKAGHPNVYVCSPEVVTPAGCMYDIWSTAYDNIRRINGFLESIDKFGENISAESKVLFEAQARFFRAFVYFQLAKRHPKGVILLDHRTMTNDNPLSDADAMWDFIAKDLDFAAEKLPVSWNAANKGRVTKGAAYALKSRAMLYAQRWMDANDAAQAVIDLGVYSLVGDYAKATAGNNTEAILEFDYSSAKEGPNHIWDQDQAPFCDGYEYGSLGTPTQEMVETFYKADGTDFDWEPWHAGNTFARPDYESLEPRFKACVIYNGCTWKGRVMECKVNGTKGEWMDYGSASYSYGKTTTGYYLKKMCNEAHTDLKNVQSSQPWVEIRYAEVLLNKAEAMYRAGLSGYQDPMNEIRHRASLPNITKSGDEWFKAYRRERKIELCYEGHLFWDMRRWELAHTEYSHYTVHGMKIDGVKFNYVSCDLSERLFSSKTYNLPIPIDEIENNHAITQFEEWL